MLVAMRAGAQTMHRGEVGSEQERRLAALTLAAHDSSEGSAPPVGRELGVALRTHWNSRFPSTLESGPAWTGRGNTTEGVVRVGLAWRGVTLRLAPSFWAAQNADVRLIPVGGANPYLDPMRPGSIDLPQQLGDGSAARMDPGQSVAQLTAYGARVALTSESARLGVGLSHSLLMSPDAPGFPRIEVGTSTPVATPFGDLAFTLAAGQLGQTGVAPERRTGSRSGSFAVGRWRPFRDDRLELGGARFYNRDWQGVRMQDLITPFGSLFFDAQTFGGAAADNQLMSLFGRVRAPAAGLELWAEFGVNDRQSDAREAVLELEHNSAWLFGVRRSWYGAPGTVWSVEATSASARIPSMNVFRGQAAFYEHAPVTQGHTNRGHLLGTRLLERTSGAEIRVDRHGPAGRIGLLLGTRDLANERALVTDEINLRREWSLVAEAWHANSRGLEWFARVGGIADLNRFRDGRDAYSAVLGTGVAWRWGR